MSYFDRLAAEAEELDRYMDMMWPDLGELEGEE